MSFNDEVKEKYRNREDRIARAKRNINNKYSDSVPDVCVQEVMDLFKKNLKQKIDEGKIIYSYVNIFGKEIKKNPRVQETVYMFFHYSEEFEYCDKKYYPENDLKKDYAVETVKSFGVNSFYDAYNFERRIMDALASEGIYSIYKKGRRVDSFERDFLWNATREEYKGTCLKYEMTVMTKLT